MRSRPGRPGGSVPSASSSTTSKTTRPSTPRGPTPSWKRRNCACKKRQTESRRENSPRRSGITVRFVPIAIFVPRPRRALARRSVQLGRRNRRLASTRTQSSLRDLNRFSHCPQRWSAGLRSVAPPGLDSRAIRSTGLPEKWVLGQQLAHYRKVSSHALSKTRISIGRSLPKTIYENSPVLSRRLSEQAERGWGSAKYRQKTYEGLPQRPQKVPCAPRTRRKIRVTSQLALTCSPLVSFLPRARFSRKRRSDAGGVARREPRDACHAL